MTVLVTGGTGFVAGWCIAALLDRGYPVRTTVRDPDRSAGVRAAGAGLSFATADLTRDAGWDEAVAGCDYVLHVAAPMGNDGRAGADTLTAAARDGALRVLAAATRAGVKRVVMTSSTAASTPRDPSGVSDETVWTDEHDPNLTPYRRAKLLAERAAWDFMATQGGGTELTTILPAAVFGPVRAPGNTGSVDVIARLLTGRPPVLPRLGFTVVDVRDLADLHINAMTAPAAAGERFVGAGGFLWLAEIARTLRTHLGDRARKVPTRGVPDGVVRALARFAPPLRTLTPLLSRDLTFSSAKAQRLLAFAPRPATTTVLDCAESLLVEGHPVPA